MYRKKQIFKSESNVVRDFKVVQEMFDKPGCCSAGGKKTYLKYILGVKWIGLRNGLDVRVK